MKDVDGFHKKQSYCKPCMSEYFKAYYKQRKEHYLKLNNKNRKLRLVKRRDYIRTVKDKPCADCKLKYPYYIMDFDHLKDKVEDVPKLLGYASRKRIQAEITKCEVVCANCHRLRTQNRYLAKNKSRTHLSPRQIRNIAIKNEAKNKPCADCNNTFEFCQMDLDHIPGTKKVMGVGHLAQRASTDLLLVEISKCEAVCANCHRHRTFNRLTLNADHLT